MAQPETRWMFLDRDGVLVEDNGYVYKTKDVRLRTNAIAGLQKLKTLGFKFIVATNQAGIARGLYALHDAEKFNGALCADIESKGVHIEKVYLCPHHPDFTGACACRKPGTGMAEEAARDFSIDLRKSVFVGDKDSDTEFGKNCGGTTFRITGDKYENLVRADYDAKDLAEVAGILEKTEH